MVNAPVADVKPREASFFATKCHIFRFAELNGLLLRSEKIKYIFFSNAKFHFEITELLFSYINAKYLCGFEKIKYLFFLWW